MNFSANYKKKCIDNKITEKKNIIFKTQCYKIRYYIYQ